MDNNLLYLGTTMKNPIKLSGGRAVVTSDGAETIECALYELLSTPKGSRFFLPEYGSNLDQLLFEPNDDATEGMTSGVIQDAIDTWEPRVAFRGVDYTYEGAKVNCIITVLILATNIEHTFVYPFYKKLEY